MFYVCSVDVCETDDRYVVRYVHDNLRGAVDDHVGLTNLPFVDASGVDNHGYAFDDYYVNTPLGVTRFETLDDVVDAFGHNGPNNRYHGPVVPRR